MVRPILLILSLYIATAAPAMLGPCKKGDNECLMKSINYSHGIIFKGLPSLGLVSIDPLFVEVIEGDLPMFKFKLTNNTARGYKDCVANNVKLDLDNLKGYLEIDCPSLCMSGTYDINGTLITLPIEGCGSYEIVTSKYSIAIEMDIKIIKGHKGKSYINIQDFHIKPQALGPIKFDFKNLTSSQKDLCSGSISAETILNFLNAHWKIVADYVQEPIFMEELKIIYCNYNKFLSTQPLEEIFFD